MRQLCSIGFSSFAQPFYSFVRLLVQRCKRLRPMSPMAIDYYIPIWYNIFIVCTERICGHKLQIMFYVHHSGKEEFLKMLELKNIHWKLSEGEEILKGVNFTIPDGKLTVVTGPNGGGKTSIAKIIAGLYSPSDGNIFLDGKDITERDITERARDGIAYAFQQPVRFKGLTVRDLIEMSAEEKLKEEKICEILGEVGLCAREYMDREADASLSGGESKRIEIATVLARKNASMLVFDEPEAGIDLWSFGSLISAFERLKNEDGRSLLVISHQERIMEIADYIIVISDGKVSAEGSREDILPTLLKENSSEGKCPLGRSAKEEF